MSFILTSVLLKTFKRRELLLVAIRKKKYWQMFNILERIQLNKKKEIKAVQNLRTFFGLFRFVTFHAIEMTIATSI